MYKLTLSKEHNGKLVQHFAGHKSIIDQWVRDYRIKYPDETIRVYQEEYILLETHKGSEVKD